MNKLKVAVIGCGSIAQFRHLPEYKANPHVEIVAVCDVNEARVQEIAEKYRAKPYTSFEEVLKNENVDIVSVCTPNYLHAPMTIAALNAGAHVLCEKPMATSSEEANAMIEAATKNGKKLMIAHNQRFVASHKKARTIIQNGELGKVYSFRTTFGHRGPEGWSIDGKDSWFFNKDKAFVGAMGDLGVHKSDLLRYILGEEFIEVGAFVESNAKEFSNVDDNAVCILKTESGIVGTLAASWGYNKEDNSTIIYGEKGVLRLEDDPHFSMIIQYANGEVTRFELGKIQSNDEGGQKTSYVIDHFVESILEDKAPPVPGEEGMKSLQVILAALKSSETRQIVKLSEVQ